ncbi:type VII secretion EsaA-like protein [Lysinibacillus composti]|uniref:Type VII secretion protein EsaA n=1 Tax=Lysinibacillus composti TaxID=720633 RepID=A0A3N9UDZ0_9BACI|nr:type VII secretion protein EsaA [Lysinibacillus composti]MBM7608888.1 type VII secretion EsaA-like protein [Lysinibacillus composti]RQW74467.1 type VII secretion protein EsaA [Lysinibacillus composti]
MTAQKKLMLKIAIVMILIIGAPILYFLAIGENPFFDESSGTKKIAVVNEDTGAENEESALAFGKEVAPILSTDTSYDWSVVSRSAAEKGLANQDYDAVIYIPSNFSKNIMTYEEQQPVKAEFKYNVSGQLNTANREKVLREIDKATARVNGKISTLYWSYVSQDLEEVREEFDTILQKEIEFLNTISDFYRPNLSGVVGDIEDQKSLLENIANSVKSAPIDGNTRQAEDFEEQLAQFVTYVNNYQEYQTSAQQLLQTVQNENLTAVLDMKSAQDPRYNEMKTYLIEQNEKFSSNVRKLEDQLAKNGRNVTNLADQVVTQRDEIMNLLKQVEGEMIVQYESQVISLKKQLNGSTPATNPTTQASSVSGKVASNTSNLVASSKIAALDSQRAKLLDLVQEINALKEQAAAVAGNTDESIADQAAAPSVGSVINEQLSQLSDQITNIEESIHQIQQQEKQLQEQLLQSLGEEEAPVVVPSTPGNEKSIINEIERKESEIVNLPLINDGKKERLKSVFYKSINSDNSTLLMEYYGALAQYETALKTNLSSDSNFQELSSNVNKILGINEKGTTLFDELQAGVPASQQQLTSLEEGLTSFFTKQMEKVDSDYEVISEQLEAVETSASNMQESLDTFIAGSSESSSSVADGSTLVSNQQSISQNLQAMSNSMNTIMENQDNIMSVTNDLHAKAADVNADTQELNSKWNENVDTTEKYRNDIHDVLNNAFIDGQKNGQIYEHLSTPLAANSLDSSVQENKLPPVIVLVIVLISSLLIGYFCYYFKNNKTSVRIALFSLLNLIVGLIISIYGLDIYPLNETGAIEWTIFTVLLLTAVSSVIFAGFSIGNLIGWFVSVAVIAFFITPMLTLLASNIDYEDPMTKVYLSIQYGPESLIVPASIVLLVIIAVAAFVPYITGRIKNRASAQDEETSYEM